MKDLSPRIGAVEARLALDAEPCPAPRIHVREQSFSTTAALQQWTAEQQARARARRFEPDSGGVMVTLVRRCAPGEKPSARDLGEATRRPAKAGAVIPS